ncbi:MAG: MBL fold metallo-hydrolase [Polaromonas sp.]|uniref:MBL fold metallo-hydrolase n=1 Tax=Polaromonas sp. TaxID=1869339 RepID=UPI0018524653|nr:MBL fold metallo-hydrolase [Polaromonas sp.]MBA3594838.1 MBL fold metallo-hydrolase [Polaromonas sp.]
MLRFKSLGSGSTGNATLIEATGLHSKRVLVDCGLGIRQLSARLAEAGLAETDIDAIFITHEHSDHIGCARQLALRHRIPIWMSRGTCEGGGLTDLDGLLHIARDGQAVDLGELELMPFTVPHDAREPLQLTCTDGATKIGLLTDLGHATTHLLGHLANCNALLLECNHDVDLLAQSAYPPFLKKRVAGLYGHLSNTAAAGIARSVAHDGLKVLVAAHLSLQNNRPDLVRQVIADVMGSRAEVVVAHATEGTRWIAV